MSYGAHVAPAGVGSSSLAVAVPAQTSTCVEPDSRELIRSVSTVLHRRISDNEDAESKMLLPLFMEDTHTVPTAEDRYAVTLPLLHFQQCAFPTLYQVSHVARAICRDHM